MPTRLSIDFLGIVTSYVVVTTRSLKKPFEVFHLSDRLSKTSG